MISIDCETGTITTTSEMHEIKIWYYEDFKEREDEECEFREGS